MCGHPAHRAGFLVGAKSHFEAVTRGTPMTLDWGRGLGLGASWPPPPSPIRYRAVLIPRGLCSALTEMASPSSHLHRTRRCFSCVPQTVSRQSARAPAPPKKQRAILYSHAPCAAGAGPDEIGPPAQELDRAASLDKQRNSRPRPHITRAVLSCHVVSDSSSSESMPPTPVAERERTNTPSSLLPQVPQPNSRTH
jgi:hypothetical protein